MVASFCAYGAGRRCGRVGDAERACRVCARLACVLLSTAQVLGSNFAKVTEMYEDDIARFSAQDYDKDGIIDEHELRDFIRTKRREGLLRRDVDVSIAALMEKYDEDRGGFLRLEQFTKLQQDVLAEPTDPFQLLQKKLDTRLLAIEEALAAIRKGGTEDEDQTKLSRAYDSRMSA